MPSGLPWHPQQPCPSWTAPGWVREVVAGLGTLWEWCASFGGDRIDALVPSQPVLCQAGVALHKIIVLLLLSCCACSTRDGSVTLSTAPLGAAHLW